MSPLALPWPSPGHPQGGLTAFPSLAFSFGKATGSSPLTLLWPFPFGIAWECSPRKRMTLITLFRFHKKMNWFQGLNTFPNDNWLTLCSLRHWATTNPVYSMIFFVWDKRWEHNWESIGFRAKSKLAPKTQSKTVFLSIYQNISKTWFVS